MEPNEQTDDLLDKALQSPVRAFRKIPDDSLIHYAYKTEIPEAIKSETDFQTLEDFPNYWIGLSKNALGLFIYHRGNGPADILTIVNDTISNGGFGETISWPIREFKKLDDYKYYFGLGGDMTSTTYARCTIEIINSDTLFSIQSTQVYEPTELGEKLLIRYSGIYVPNNKQHLFYHINEPNTKNPDARVPTEEIDLEELKKEKTG